MTDRASIVKIIEDTWTARRADDCPGTMAQFAADSRFRFVCSPDFGVMSAASTGADVGVTMANFIKEWNLSGLSIDSIAIDGDTAYVRHSGKAINNRTRNAMEADVLDVIRIRDGKIVEYTQFTDTYLVAKTAGLIKGL